MLAMSAASGLAAATWTGARAQAPAAKRIDQFDPALEKIISTTEPIKDIAFGFGGPLGSAEGPVWIREGGYLLFSDINASKRMKYSPGQGVTVFQENTHQANGLTRDQQGRIVACEHETRRVTRRELDGSLTVIANSFQGKRLNRPNDVVVKSDGSIWFSDPSYGIDSDYEGDAAPSEIGACQVYRFDPASGEIAVVAADFVQPNGLAFSPDESLLYIADTGVSHVTDGPHHIRRFDVGRDGKSLVGGAVFATCPVGVFDGFRIDKHGHLWSSAGDGVCCYHPDGTLLGKVRVPEVVANVCFGGAKRDRLFICGTTSLYSVYLNTQGAVRPAPRS
jgi:gluconolactonase